MVRILLVEDNKDFNAVYTFSLRSLGHDVTSVFSGVDALKLYKENPFDIVLSDTRLDPEDEPSNSSFRYREGIKLLINILDYDSSARVVILSSMEKNKAPALDNGALGFEKKDDSLPNRFEEILKKYLILP